MRITKAFLFVAIAGVLLQADNSELPTNATRAVAILNGVFSPRGFFNITVRLNQLSGLEWAKFDLKKSRITLDFQPGITVTEKEIRNVMVSAGYKPGPVTIEALAPEQVSETGPGWVKVKHPRARNPLKRWLELNF